jgi:nucleotide-binding universal stress UspA family protein
MLFATDFSGHADRVFDAFSYLRHATEEATPVHVRSPKDEGVDADASPEEQLTEYASTLETRDIETRIEVRHGDPADEILAVEAAVNDLGRIKGASRIRRLLLGSVLQEVIA